MDLLIKYKDLLNNLEAELEKLDYASPLTVAKLQGKIELCKEIIADFEKSKK